MKNYYPFQLNNLNISILAKINFGKALTFNFQIKYLFNVKIEMDNIINFKTTQNY